MFLKSLFMRGTTHVPHNKNTAGAPPVRMTDVKDVLIPVSQHIGAPAAITVKVGDTVKVGSLIAEAQGYVSSPVHSSVSGTVKKIDTYLSSSGRRCDAVLIESDGMMTPDPAIAPPVITDFDSLSSAVRNSGVVGLGGAGFPTAVKLDAQKKGLIKRIVVNGAECEPYITSDTHTMLNAAQLVKEGAELLLKYIDAEELVIGIENNKPECIANMQSTFADDPRVRVASLPSTYPQGGEKILIYNTTGLVVPEGGLPADVGCLVINVTTLAFIASYARTGMPLVEKCITVDGSAVKDPKNVIVPIGARVRDVLAFVNVDEEQIGKALYGGPMMGIAICSLDEPVMKNNNAITVMDKREAVSAEPTPCIHCGRCVAACPMGLNPTAYAKAQNCPDEPDKIERLKAAKINLCIECGCCSYVCPAKRPLVQTNRISKSDVREFEAKQRAIAEKNKANKEENK